ncbi:hypothetical protein F5884DRAFT_753539 [Xylogone sp. PMI_703]|nr:hypothetical protein F5884DRAFT_753539 [Xylogone sp. PMI_703]
MPPKRRASKGAGRKSKRRASGRAKKAAEGSSPGYTDEEGNYRPASRRRISENNPARDTYSTRASTRKDKADESPNRTEDNDSELLASPARSLSEADDELHDEPSVPCRDESANPDHEQPNHSASPSNIQPENHPMSQVEQHQSDKSINDSSALSNDSSDSEESSQSKKNPTPAADNTRSAVILELRPSKPKVKAVIGPPSTPQCSQAEHRVEIEKEPSTEPDVEARVYVNPHEGELLTDKQLSRIRRNMQFLLKDERLSCRRLSRMRLGNTQAKARAEICKVEEEIKPECKKPATPYMFQSRHSSTPYVLPPRHNATSHTFQSGEFDFPGLPDYLVAPNDPVTPDAQAAARAILERVLHLAALED